MSKVDYFSVGDGIYMLPSNMNLNINKTRGYNNKILISKSSYKLGVNNRVNAAADGKSRTSSSPLRQLEPHEKRHALEHNDEKLALSILVTGTALLIY